MLELKGNSAVIMLVAKGGLDRIADVTARLQAGIAVMAGLAQPDWVRKGDIIAMVAELHDRLIEAGLVTRPTLGLVDYIKTVTLLGDSKESVADLLLGSMLSNMRLMRVRTEEGVRLIDWTAHLPPDFEKTVYRLDEQAYVVEA